MTRKREHPVFNDADEKIRDEIKAIVRARPKDPRFRGFITESEYQSRRRLGLPCDGFFLASEIKKLARQMDLNRILTKEK